MYGRSSIVSAVISCVYFTLMKAPSDISNERNSYNTNNEQYEINETHTPLSGVIVCSNDSQSFRTLKKLDNNINGYRAVNE